MKRIVIGISILALAALAVLSMGSMPSTHAATSAAGTCLEKHCPPNSHCCTSCSDGSPFCVRNGVGCPVCP